MTIEGIGVFRVRGLNRLEVMATQKMDDPIERDLHIIAIGLVEPRLSVSEVRRWAEASPAGEMEPVSTKIADLSGILPDAAKRAVMQFEANPDEEFRALPSPEVVNDGGAPARGDVG